MHQRSLREWPAPRRACEQGIGSFARSHRPEILSPHRLMRRAVPLVIVLACLLAPAAAGASSRGGKKVLHECAETGVIANPGRYTHSDYEYALKHIPSDL